MCERSLELMCERASKRVAFGQPLASMGTVKSDIAWSRVEIDQIRMLTENAARLMDVGGNKHAKKEIAMIKVMLSTSFWLTSAACRTQRCTKGH